MLLVWRKRNFRSVQVNDLPCIRLLLENDGTAIQKPRPVIEKESCDRDVSGKLNFQISGLQVHVRPLSLSCSNALKNLLEKFFEFGASIRTKLNLSWIEHRGVVSEGSPEPFPVEIVEGLNKTSESLSDLGLTAVDWTGVDRSCQSPDYHQ